jgi:periplasmic protein TonB
MAGCIQDHSDLANWIAYPAVTHPRAANVVRESQHWGDEQDLAASGLQETKAEVPLFQDSLIASGNNLPKRNPWATFGSLAFQLLVLALLVLVPLFHTEILPKSEQVVTQLYLPPLPAAAPPPAAVNVAKPRTPTPVTQVSTPHPKAISIPQRQEAPPAPSGAVGGVPGGVAGGVLGGVVGGVPGGVLGGVLGATGTAPVLAPAAPRKIHVAPHVAEGNLVHDVTPQYPPEAGRNRIQGNVVLQAVIGKDGTVRDVRVESGLPVLAQAAINAVKQWRYRPYMLNGEPVEVDTEITINFTLTGA